ncbi:alpha/beta fold hydrolase [Halocynthiibacter styelae]|uniref:Alpha/beta hydrolase n=1 Tax=Halocynthiibacter styelae TaxID=2761955 RepID=A0A8J7LJK8_9RHOB|nr:alpha/beta hydrolase [Paenihalocynthiibacter styelae]MBI1492470.1 alpha/beta hydrolase [Paenihalocynthiibacter styelae]
MSEPLVLVPGMMSDARVFMPQIVELTKTHSVQVAPVSQADSIREMAHDVLRGAPEQFALAGHSMGGVVAMEVLRQAPDRVSKLALISTSATTESPAQAAEREPLMVRARAGRLAEVMEETLRADVFFDGPARSQILNLIQEMATRLGADVFVRQSRALQSRPDQQRTLRTTRIPVLVLGGENDRLTPPARHEFIAGLVERADLRILPNAGHLPMVEAADAVTEALRNWLSGPLILR